MKIAGYEVCQSRDTESHIILIGCQGFRVKELEDLLLWFLGEGWKYRYVLWTAKREMLNVYRTQQGGICIYLPNERVYLSEDEVLQFYLDLGLTR